MINVRHVARLQGALFAVILCIVLMIGWTAWNEREQVLRSAHIQALNLAQLMAEQTTRIFEFADLMGGLVARDLIETPGWEEPSSENNPVSQQIHQMLRARSADLPPAFGVIVLDRSGRLIHESGSRVARPFDGSGRDYFRQLRDAPTDEAVMGSPVVGPLSDDWHIPVARRITLPGGNFGGVVVVGMRSSYFRDLYQRIDIGKNGIVALVRSDATLYFSNPLFPDAMGRRIKSAELLVQRLGQQARGTAEFSTKVDNTSRIGGYDRLSRYPFVAVVAHDKREVLAGWRDRTTLSVLATASVCLLLAWMGSMVGRQLKRRVELERSMQESREAYGLLAANSTDIIARLDMQGRIQFVSPSVRELLGYEPDSLICQYAFDMAHPDDRDRVVRQFFKFGDSADTDRAGLIYRLRHCEGHFVWIEVHRRIVRNASGAPTEVISSGRDVTARIRAASELNKAKRAAEAANRAKSEFLAVMSHEIRTPLTGVLASADLLMEGPLTAPQAKRVELLRRSARSLQSLLSDFLDFAKIEAGKLVLHEVDFSPAKLMQDAANLFELSARERGNTLSVHAGGLPELVRGDELRVRQVLLNLLDNAAKFTRDGTIAIEGHASPDGRTLTFSVRDTGVGFSPAMKEHLFDAFTQADSSTTREFGGTGLGLAICRRLAEAMGGHVEADSQPGHGSVFTFSVRVAPVAATVNAAQDARWIDAATAPTQFDAGICARILVAEDNMVNRLLIVEVLERSGHAVEAVENGRLAVQAASKAAYDVILMDLRMPVLDGIEAARAIRALPDPHAQVPIIAMSADLASLQEQSGSGALFEAALTKPIDWQALHEQIRRLVGKSLPVDFHAGGDHPAPQLEPSTNGVARDIDERKLERMRHMIGDGKLGSLLDEFRQQLAGQVAELETAVERGERDAVQDLAHRLQGAAAHFGCTRLASAAAMLHDKPSAEHCMLLRQAAQAALSELAAWQERRHATSS